MGQAARAVACHPDWISSNRRSHLVLGSAAASQLEAFRTNTLGGHSDGCLSSLLLELSSGWGVATVSGKATSGWFACSFTLSGCLGMVPPSRGVRIGSIDCILYCGTPPDPLAGRGSSGF